MAKFLKDLQIFRRGGSACSLSSRSGMTLLEIMIVVSIIGLLAVIAIPSFLQARRSTQDAAFMNDLRRLQGDVFDLYALDTGDLPADVPTGVLPAGIGNYLPRHFEWTERTHIGGYWDWERGADPSDKVFGICYAGLRVHLPGRTVAQMREIDQAVDDGNLSTGIMRSAPDGYIFIVQP